MAGYQVDSVCYPTAMVAAQAFASGLGGGPWSVGSAACSGAYTVSAGGTEGAPTLVYTLTKLAGTCISPSPASYTVAFAPSPCGLLDWEDGLAVGWGIAAAWIAVAVVLFLRKAAHS